MTLERVVALSSVGVPNLGLFVKGSCNNFVSALKLVSMMKARYNNLNRYLPERVIEGHAVDHVVVLVQREQLLPRVCIPNLTGPVVAARDELVSTLVESAIG